MRTMEGGEPVIDWAALAPHIAHPTRKAIVQATLQIGEPLAVADLLEVLNNRDSTLSLSRVAYHVETLVSAEILTQVGERITGTSIEPLYFFPSSA